MILDTSLAKKLLLVIKLGPPKDKNVLTFFSKSSNRIEILLEMNSHLQNPFANVGTPSKSFLLWWDLTL